MFLWGKTNFTHLYEKKHFQSILWTYSDPTFSRQDLWKIDARKAIFSAISQTNCLILKVYFQT